MAALLDVSDVTLRYKTSSAVVTATERVSFTVDRSDRFVLLGPSGCGKSTLLKAVGGYMAPSEGKMRISGREISEPGADRMMIFQEFDQLLPWKTVLENVMFPLMMTRRLPRKDAEARARAYLEKVSLTRVVDAYPHTLSGGMKQRVAIARGMAMEPDILLMDEVERKLTVPELLWNDGFVRKTVIILFLAVAWEAYGAYLDNPLLFPTFHDTIITMFDKVRDGTIPLRAWASLKVLFMGYSAGIVLAAIFTI